MSCVLDERNIKFGVKRHQSVILSIINMPNSIKFSGLQIPNMLKETS